MGKGKSMSDVEKEIDELHKPVVDVVDVDGGDFHSSTSDFATQSH
jgi:hypothetical protein